MRIINVNFKNEAIPRTKLIAQPSVAINLSPFPTRKSRRISHQNSFKKRKRQKTKTDLHKLGPTRLAPDTLFRYPRHVVFLLIYDSSRFVRYGYLFLTPEVFAKWEFFRERRNKKDFSRKTRKKTGNSRRIVSIYGFFGTGSLWRMVFTYLRPFWNCLAFSTFFSPVKANVLMFLPLCLSMNLKTVVATSTDRKAGFLNLSIN